MMIHMLGLARNPDSSEDSVASLSMQVSSMPEHEGASVWETRLY